MILDKFKVAARRLGGRPLSDEQSRKLFEGAFFEVPQGLRPQLQDDSPARRRPKQKRRK